MKVVIIFHRFGPYHLARLRVAASVFRLVGLETSGADATYAWDKIQGADGFQRITLFESADAQKQPASEVANRMCAALDKARPQVVVIPGWADSAALAALKWTAEYNIPAVTMSESTAWDVPRKAWKESVKRRIVGLCSAALVGGTPHRDYIVQLGMSPDRVFLGYDAVDNDYFRTKTDYIRAQPGASSLVLSPSSLVSGRYFLASARFIEKKNLPRLLEAYALYRKNAESRNGPSSGSPLSSSPAVQWSLVLLGDGELRSSLSSLRSSLGLDAYVHLPGFKQYPELPHYYAHAGAFIHASTTEQWGLVVNEAMASGLPVLVSNRCGCARDLVQDGVNGFTFDPYNVEQLADLMLKISAMDSSSPPRERGLEAIGNRRKEFAEGEGPERTERAGASESLDQGEVSNTSLSTLGVESKRIISAWGPERFATGLKSAVEKALEVGPVKPSFMQRAILRALLSR